MVKQEGFSKLRTSFSEIFALQGSENLYQFMVIQHLPLISCLANMAGDRRLLVQLFFNNSTK